MKKRVSYIFLAAAIAGVAAVLFGMCRLRECEVGETFFVVLPTAVALYGNAGGDARDDELLYGMSCVARGRPGADGRLPVETHYGYRVMIVREGVASEKDVADSWRERPTHLVEAPSADILTAADFKSYPPIMTLPRGALLRSPGVEGDFLRVALHDGRTGFVRAALARPVREWDGADETANRERVVADALSYMGTQYRWGGKTPDGIDCSGLASMAHMMNGLAIYRNSRPMAGYPIALLHVEPVPGGGYDEQALSRAKKGDMIYWKGHQAVYLGGGKYVHANGKSSNVSINSLLPGDPEYRKEDPDVGPILAWGTAYPEDPDKLLVRKFVALPTGEPGRFRFFARADGYAPTAAVIFPEGEGEGRPSIAVDDPGEMIYGAMEAQNAGAPEYRYTKPGEYHPVVVLINDRGWLPEGRAISSGSFVMTESVSPRQ